MEANCIVIALITRDLRVLSLTPLLFVERVHRPWLAWIRSLTTSHEVIFSYPDRKHTHTETSSRAFEGKKETHLCSCCVGSSRKIRHVILMKTIVVPSQEWRWFNEVSHLYILFYRKIVEALLSTTTADILHPHEKHTCVKRCIDGENWRWRYSLFILYNNGSGVEVWNWSASLVISTVTDTIIYNFYWLLKSDTQREQNKRINSSVFLIASQLCFEEGH